MLTNEQIEQCAKAGGWRHGLITWHKPDCGGEDGYDCGCWKLPDFRTDLQACFDLLERICRPHGWVYELSMVPAGEGDSCGLVVEHFNVMIDPKKDHERFEDLPEACAVTKQEAIFLALLDAVAEKAEAVK